MQISETSGQEATVGRVGVEGLRVSGHDGIERKKVKRRARHTYLPKAARGCAAGRETTRSIETDPVKSLPLKLPCRQRTAPLSHMYTIDASKNMQRASCIAPGDRPSAGGLACQTS